MLHEPGSPHELDQEELPEGRTLAAEEPPPPLREALAGWARAGRWRLALGLTLAALLIYALAAFDRLGEPSPDTHFVYLANTYNSMLAAALGSTQAQQRRQGKVAFELDRRPPHRNDWASYWDLQLRDGERVRGIWEDQIGRGGLRRLDGKRMILEPQAIDRRQTTRRYFVSFPPAPAVLMMPAAAIWGYRVNDVWWTLLFAALNVGLMFVTLERLARGGRTGRGRRANLILTLLFALGTAHFWCSVLGQVWFTALVMGVTFTLLYVLCAIDARYPLAAGIFCALAFATRTPLLFGALLFFLFVLFPGGRPIERERWGWAARKLAWFCAPCLLVGAGLLVVNQLRFESWTEFGHTYLAGGQLERIKRHGLFDYRFLSRNLSAMWTLLPRLQSQPPYVIVSNHGMSLLVTTPALIWLARARPRLSAPDAFWHRALWATVIVCALPGLFYQNTGYAQFGYRFSLDYTPHLILLLALGRWPMRWPFYLACAWAVGVNTFGAITFKRFGQFYETFFVW